MEEKNLKKLSFSLSIFLKNLFKSNLLKYKLIFPAILITLFLVLLSLISFFIFGINTDNGELNLLLGDDFFPLSSLNDYYGIPYGILEGIRTNNLTAFESFILIISLLSFTPFSIFLRIYLLIGFPLSFITSFRISGFIATFICFIVIAYVVIFLFRFLGIKKIKGYIANCFNSSYKTFLLLLLIFAGIIYIVLRISVSQGGIMNFYTDDVIQYYPFMDGFLNKIKSGKLSLYDTGIFYGSSFFINSYYIPLDIFTFFTLILSFFIENTLAYSIINLLKPITGALLLFYILKRKGLKNYTCFIISLILFCCGLTETYYVFPVYLGIIFYAPLAMLIADLYIDNKKFFYLIPLYVMIVLFYDFYIGYMLSAFLIIYVLAAAQMKGEYKLLSKRSLIFNKNFYYYLFVTLSLILIGVLLGSISLLPSMDYIINETNRNASSDNVLWNTLTNPSLFLQTIKNSESRASFFKLLKAKDLWAFSPNHYFTQLANLFIPNEPHTYMLSDAGDYVREHASFYMTSCSFIFLMYFFSLKGQRNRALQIWIILLNVLFQFPIFSMIFTANSIPYVRWFFIPYMFNLLGVAFAIDENDFEIKGSIIKKVILCTILLISIAFIIFILTDNKYINGVDESYGSWGFYLTIKGQKKFFRRLFIHYSSDNYLFYLTLIPSLVFLLLSLIFTISIITFKNKKIFKISYKIMILCECAISSLFILYSAYNANNSYTKDRDIILNAKNQIEANSNYSVSSGYRINIDDGVTKNNTNAQAFASNINSSSFFHSFYDASLNQFTKDILNGDTGNNDNINNDWSRSYNRCYSIMQAPLYNYKYVLVGSGALVNFNSNYKLFLDDNRFKYYELENMPPFIVYDTIVNMDRYLNSTNRSSVLYNYLTKCEALLHYGYYDSNDNELVSKYSKLNLNNVRYESIVSNLKGDLKIEFLGMGDYEKIEKGCSKYIRYDVSNIRLNDVWEIYPTNKKIKNIGYEDMYVTDTQDLNLQDDEAHIHGMNYSTLYLSDDWKPKYLYIKYYDDDETNFNIYINSYSADAYINFLECQKIYTNKEFTLIGNKMHIKCEMPKSNINRIIKTAYSYSNDWKALGNYSTINIDGGFLGVVIPENLESVDITLTYEPSGLNKGYLYTSIGVILFFGSLGTTYYLSKNRKRKEE